MFPSEWNVLAAPLGEQRHYIPCDTDQSSCLPQSIEGFMCLHNSIDTTHLIIWGLSTTLNCVPNASHLEVAFNVLAKELCLPHGHSTCFSSGKFISDGTLSCKLRKEVLPGGNIADVIHGIISRVAIQVTTQATLALPMWFHHGYNAVPC